VPSLLEVAERTQTGPRIEEKAWDLGLFAKMNELVRKYDIRVPKAPRHPWFNEDDSLAERAYRAALDFLVDVGVYCITTGRVVRFSREEVEREIRAAPREVWMGEGRDRRVFRQQRIEGEGPLGFCPGHHSPFTEDLASLVVKNFAQIDRADFVEGFNFPAVDGREIFGLPAEAYASRRQIAWMREGVRKAGHPGLAVVLYPISTRAAALIAPIDPVAGLRPTDGVLLSILPDVKIEHDLLTAAIVYDDYGCFHLSGSFAMAGGFCGGVEGAIVEGIVKPLAAMLCYRDYISYVGVEHVQTLSAMRIPLQPLGFARSVVSQALNTWTNTICMAWIIPTSGPCTENSLWEVAMRCIEAPINGANLYAPRHSRARLNAGQTPLEAEWMLEVSDAAVRAGLKRDTAGELLWRIAEKLRDRQPEPGLPIGECYDLVRHEPLPCYREVYLKVKEELATLGLEFA
jgi:methylamine---corrinoid protein Co-methyltransferase